MLPGILKFKNFPYDFNIRNNFVIDIFRKLMESDESISLKLHDQSFYFSGCYPKVHLLTRSLKRLQAEFSSKHMVDWLQIQNGIEFPPKKYQKNMWISFENRRSPSFGYQRTLSFDIDDHGGVNAYFPLWLTYVDFLQSGADWVRHKVIQHDLAKSRVLSVKNRKFACAFINNPSPIRLRAIDELRKVAEVDVFGRHSGRYVRDKIKASREYMFSICFENDLYPGYVTEKPLEAWLGNTVPLYWGDDVGGYLNQSSLINLKNFDSMRDFTNFVGLVYNDADMYEGFYSQPLLAKCFDVNGLLQFFKTWILE